MSQALASPPRGYGAALGALVLLAASLPFLGITGRWLWLDELLSANFSASGPWVTLVTVLRFDVHPPLYYLQLSLWMLPGQGDAWLMANAALWHAAAAGLLAAGAARLHGARVGLAAGLLLAVSPAALPYADQVRMYSFLAFLIVWVWYAQARWLAGTAGRFGWLWMILAQAAVTNSHTAGLLMISGCVVLGGLTVLAEGRPGRILRFALIEAAVAVLSLPAVVIGTMRGVSHLRAPGAEDVLDLWAFLAGGGAVLPGAAALALGAAVLAALGLGVLRDRRLLLPVVALIFVPVLVAGLLSHALKPVWIERIFVPVIPFLCLCLARAALDGPARRGAAAGVLALALLWGGIGIAGQLSREKGDGFRAAAAAVRATARAGDLVLVDGDYGYWCFLWYAAGPRWGDPRQAYILNEQWAGMMRRLPPAVAARLGLGDAHRVRPLGDAQVALWDRRDGLAPPVAGDVLLLRAAAAPPAPLAGRQLAASTPFTQLVLERWTASP